MTPIGSFRAIYELYRKSQPDVWKKNSAPMEALESTIIEELVNNKSIVLTREDENFLQKLWRILCIVFSLGPDPANFRAADALHDFQSYTEKIDSIRMLLTYAIENDDNVIKVEWPDGTTMQIRQKPEYADLHSEWHGDWLSDDDSDPDADIPAGMRIIFNGGHTLDMPGMQFRDMLTIIETDVSHRADENNQLYKLSLSK